MAWTKVGETTFNIQDDSANHDVTLPGPPAEGDIVIYATASDGAVSGGVVTSGYTDLLTDHAATNPGRDCGYKVMGATPDTIVTFNQTSGNEYAAGIVQVWRGLDTTTPIDATPTTATGASGMPDGPSFTTVTNGALVIVIGVIDDINIAASVGAPSGYSNLLAHDNTSVPPDNACAMIASLEKATAGAENPGAFTAGASSDEWAAVTFALRPAAASSGAVLAIGKNHPKLNQLLRR